MSRGSTDLANDDEMRNESAKSAHNVLKNHVSPVQFWPSAQSDLLANTDGAPEQKHDETIALGDGEQAKRGPLTASAPFAAFVAHFLSAKGLAPKTRKDYGRYLLEFDTFTGRVDLTAALTLDHAAQWVEVLRPRGAYAARNASTYLKSMASWIAKSRYVVIPGGGSLLAGLERPKTPKSRRKAITDRQLESIYRVLEERPNRDRTRAIAYVKFLVGSGLRRNEARQMTLENLHLEFDGPSWLHVAAETAKGLKERDVRLDSEAVGPLHIYIATARPKYAGQIDLPEPLFLTEDGLPFTEHGFGSWVGRVFDDIFKATGIRISSHIGRHTWATNYHRGMKDSGNSIYDMMREGGWADEHIVLTYAHERPWNELLEMKTPAQALRDRKSAVV